MTFLKQLINNRMMKLAMLLYAITSVVSYDKFRIALDGSLYYFKEMLLIMPVVFMMTVLIDVWVPRQMISKSLGEQSGIKGIFFALALGSVSAGPIYAAFPITKALLKKGAGIMNSVIILSAWAVIKVPMLANEARFLGAEFMVTRWVLTVIVIIAIGYIASLMIKPKELFINEVQLAAPKIDEKTCIGCKLCLPHAGGLIVMDGKKALIHLEEMTEEQIATIKKAYEICPVTAIRL